MLHDTHERYGSLTRFFHWLVAVLVLEQFLKFFDRIDEGKHWIGENIVPFHTSVGALILLLVVARLIWRIRQRPNRPLPHGLPGKIGRFAHRIMYACLLLMPPLGALYIYGKGYPVKLFGAEVIAKPAGEVQWAITIGEMHSVLAFLLLFLVLAHIAGALYHHKIRQDDTLKRML